MANKITVEQFVGQLANQRFGRLAPHEEKFLKAIRGHKISIRFNADPQFQQLIGELLGMCFWGEIPVIEIVISW